MRFSQLTSIQLGPTCSVHPSATATPQMIRLWGDDHTFGCASLILVWRIGALMNSWLWSIRGSACWTIIYIYVLLYPGPMVSLPTRRKFLSIPIVFVSQSRLKAKLASIPIVKYISDLAYNGHCSRSQRTRPFHSTSRPSDLTLL
jgi:hypothetical protein